MRTTDALPVVREGVWQYAALTPIAVRVLLSPESLGTGDYEDEESVREGQQMQCYFVAYEMAGAPGVFCNLIPNLPSLREAILLVESKFPGIQWRQSEHV